MNILKLKIRKCNNVQTHFHRHIETIIRSKYRSKLLRILKIFENSAARRSLSSSNKST